MAILNATTETRPNGVRLYTGPKFARYAGLWSTVDDLLRVHRDGDAYVVALGDEYITMAPAGTADKAALAAAVAEDIVEPTHFGPKLDPKLLTADRLTWRLDWSKGVRAEADGLVFGGVEGVKLGVFFRRWQQNLKSDCTIDLAAKPEGPLTGTVELNLARAKAFAEAADLPHIDLDPETVLVSDAEAAFRAHSITSVPIEGPQTWDAVYGATNSVSSEAAIETVVRWTCSCAITRTALTFDLSAFGPPVQACLYLHRVGASPSEVRLTGPGLSLPITNAVNYSKVVQGQAIGGDWTAMGGNWLRSPEIVAVLGRAVSYDLGVRGSLDTPAVPPSGYYAYTYDSTGQYAAYLEITLPELVPGGTSTSTATARGHKR